MKLSECKIGDLVVIKDYINDEILKFRTYSFGLMIGSSVEIINISLAKQTMQIKNEDGTLIALRLSEANHIEVSRL